MKIFNFPSLLLLSTLFISIFSCENEPLEGDFTGLQNPVDPFETTIVGTWQLVGFTNNIDSSIENDSEVISESELAINSFSPNYQLTFTDTNFATSGSYSYNYDIMVTDQEPISENYTIDAVNASGSYFITNNTLTTSQSFFQFSAEGMDLAQLSGEQTATYLISSDGQTLTFTQSTTETTTEGDLTLVSTVTGTSTWSRAGATSTSCVEATNFANSAQTAYNNDTTNTDLCNAYKSALQNQINACGDLTGVLQAVIDSLADCTGTTETSSLIGEWQLLSQTENEEELTLSDCELLETIEFIDPDVLLVNSSFDSETPGDDSCESETIPFNYVLNGNIITATEEGLEPLELEILTLTETTLVTKFFEDIEGETYTSTYTYTRL